jgi:hypothetical protein
MSLNQNNQPHNINDTEVYEHLLETFKNHGLVFPDTEEELDLFMLSIEDINEPIPEELQNPLDVVFRKNNKKILPVNFYFDNQDKVNLAMAAREGSEISEDILKIMEEDRQRTENESDK